ncbi:MAG: hemolysin family protein [Spirochaetaceae bacterium]|nr:hemolysin family protein [Spirochaetaceae bacterium]
MDTFTNIIPVLLVLLLSLSSFFSASETAFMSLNRIKLKNLVSRGGKTAASTLSLLENYDKLISAILIGNNIVNIASSSLAAFFFVGIFGNMGVSIATLVMTVLVLLIGEITPKTLARESPEKFAIFCTPLLIFFIFLFSPFNYLMVRWKQFTIALFRVKSDRSITEEELLTFVEEARQEGGINEHEEVMIKRTINFDEITAHEICTPRVDLTAVSLTDSVESIDACFRETRYSRLPVYDGSIDNIVGLLLLKDFHYEVIGAGRTPQDIIKPVVYIPQTIKAARLLRLMQEKKSHLAVILDEFGGTLGIVTIEDIVEELVGEIWDEHDVVIKNITECANGEIAVLGRTPIAEICEYYGIESSGLAGKTLAVWVLEISGGAVRVGDVFSLQGIEFRVSKIHHNRVIEMMAKLP